MAKKKKTVAKIVTPKEYKVSGLSISRGGNTYTANWTVPAKLKKNAPNLNVQSRRTGGWETENAKRSIKGTSETLIFDRGWYWPCSGTTLGGIGVRVKGNGTNSITSNFPWVEAWYGFSRPGTPSISLALNDNCDQLTATINSPEGSGNDERYDTVVEWNLEYWIGGRYSGWFYYKDSAYNGGTEFTSESGDLTSGLGGVSVLALKDDEWVRCSVRAKCRGLAGDGDWTGWHDHVFGKPPKASLGEPVLTSEQVIIPVTVPYDASCPHHTDSVQLYRYIGTSRAQNVDDWTEVDGACDNGSCNGLHDARAQAEPSETGQRVWYMVRSTHDSYKTWSDPVECTGLYKQKDTSTASQAYVISATNNADGDSATIVCGWENDSAANYDTTVLAWSTDQMAWRSNKEPTPFEMKDVTWQEEGTIEHEGKQLNYTSIKVTGLDDGKRWWFRAHRTSQSNDQEGSWSEAVPCDISSTPPVPVLTVPDTVERGKAFGVSWAAGDTEQSAWRLMCLDSLAGSGTAHEVCLMQGTGAATTATVAAGESKLEGMSSAQLAIEVSSGGDYVRSEAASVAFADAPKATVSTERLITASGHKATVTVDQDGADVTLTLVKAGSSTECLPDGSGAYADGDIIWTSGATATRSKRADFAIPADVHLVDGCCYRLLAVPSTNLLTGAAAEPSFTYTITDEETGGTSTVTTTQLTVAWAHQAAAVQTCSITIGEDGTATITPTKPEGADGTDTWSLYRATPDGITELLSGMEWGRSASDEVPPFSCLTETVDTLDDEGNVTASTEYVGHCAYRVATFTADGDCDWNDFDYANFGKVCRIDWGGGSVELPYDLEVSDNFSKSFEGRTFLDQAKQGGTWAPGIERSVSIDTSVVQDVATSNALRNLAQYAGACFVRLPDGRAFEADVQVNGIDDSYGKAYTSVSIVCTEVEPAEYLATPVPEDSATE